MQSWQRVTFVIRSQARLAHSWAVVSPVMCVCGIAKHFTLRWVYTYRKTERKFKGNCTPVIKVLSIVNCLFVCLALNLTSSKRFKSTNSYTRGLFEIFYFFQFIMGPSFLEGGPIMYRIDAVRLSVRPSVCLSVPCLHLEGKRKGLGRPNLVGRVPGTRAPRGPVSKSKGQGHGS